MFFDLDICTKNANTVDKITNIDIIYIEKEEEVGICYYSFHVVIIDQ